MTEAPHNVLVVDDEFASLEVLALLLVGEGLNVVTASNGEEALLRLAEAHVDLVITDYKMPKMDGSELCLRMLADPQLQRIPVIFTSATYRQDVPRPANVAAFFSKPLLFSQVLRSVRQLLDAEVTPP
ncbi:MAG TPA: response regulator [Polyangiaceae bacterium]|jgi:chemosensory pili system protein ChpA (sensor histidine kinase/response regulator)